MKATAVLKKYYKKRTKELKLILSKPKKNVSVKDFHKLRVNIKKMRALLQLVQFSSRKIKKKRYHKVYKKLFKQSGRVRELQIEIAAVQRIGINGSLQNYLNDLKNRKDKEKDKWFLLATKKTKKKLTKNFKSLRPYFKNADNAKVSRFIEKKGKNIKRLIRKRIKRKRLHKLRKQLKVIYYILTIISKKKNLRKAIQRTQKLLGRWHDCEVMSRHLQHILDKEELHYKEKQAIETLKEKITNKRKRLFSEIKTSDTLSTQLTAFL